MDYFIKVRFCALCWLSALFFFMYASHASAKNNTSSPFVLSIADSIEKNVNGIYEMSIKIENKSDTLFNGQLVIASPQGAKLIGNALISLHIEPKSSFYVSLKFQDNGILLHSESAINIALQSSDRRIWSKLNTQIRVEENTQAFIELLQASYNIINLHDSIPIKIKVYNKGNIPQYFEVILALDEEKGRVFKQTGGWVKPAADSVFSFMINPALLFVNTTAASYIGVSALKGENPVLFASEVILVNFASNTKKYNYGKLIHQNSNVYNSLSLSYRQLGEDMHAFNLMGNTFVNLPVGNLFFKSNISKSNKQEEFIATNTSVSYAYNNNLFTVGNINDASEMNIFGRGFKVDLNDKEKANRLEVGIVDNNFNLFSSENLGIFGFTAFVNRLYNVSSKVDLLGEYVFKRDEFDYANHHLVSAGTNLRISPQVNIQAKLYGSSSDYYTLATQKLSGAANVHYQVLGNTSRWVGSFFWSEAYFPGNRRGMLNLQNAYHQQLKGGWSYFLNLSYLNYAPKNYYSSYNVHTNFVRLDLGLNLPKMGKTNSSISLQGTWDQSNTYNQIFDLPTNMQSEIRGIRLLHAFSYFGTNIRHQITANTEVGWQNTTFYSPSNLQLKFNLGYHYKWLNLGVIYQNGASNLSEYVPVFNYQKNFERLIPNISIRHNFRDKLFTYLTANYNFDFILGSSPSINFSTRYNITHVVQAFLNASWYQYNYVNFNMSSFYTGEVGVAFNFKNTSVYNGRKHNLTGFLYLDKNANDVFDGDDEPVKQGMVVFNDQVFITDDKGYFKYLGIPQANYKIKTIIHNNWFYVGHDVAINKQNNKLQFPLKQSGTFMVKIKYVFDEFKALETKLYKENIVFNLYLGDRFIRKYVTNSDGEITGFLPNGSYRLVLDESSLPLHTQIKYPNAQFSITSGKVTKIPQFEIDVAEKQIKMKRFGEQK